MHRIRYPIHLRNSGHKDITYLKLRHKNLLERDHTDMPIKTCEYVYEEDVYYANLELVRAVSIVQDGQVHGLDPAELNLLQHGVLAVDQELVLEVDIIGCARRYSFLSFVDTVSMPLFSNDSSFI